MKELIAAGALLLAAGQACALEVVLSRVTNLEASYMPHTVQFQLAAGTASCPAGSWLRWQRDADSNKAVYATVLAAMLNGKQVRFYVNDGDTSCVGQFLHLVD